MAATPRYRDVSTVVPTIFDKSCALDCEGQRRCIDFMIDAGSNCLCILANCSERCVLAANALMREGDIIGCGWPR